MPRDAARPRTVRRPVTGFPGILAALTALPRYRGVLAALTRHRITVRYRQSLLGPLWAIVQPLGLMIVLTAVFSWFARVPATGHPYALFAYAGLLPWTAFAAGLGSGAVSLVAHAGLVTRVYFPREILPATYVAAALVDLATASLLLVPLLWYFGVPLTWAVVWLAPILVVLTAFCLAMALALCAVHVRFRDVGIAMPLLLQVWMFASPVVYPLEAVPAHWRWAYVLNPMAGVVDGFRRAVLDGAAPDAAAFGTAAAVTAVVLIAAYAWFKRVEATMADAI